MFNKDSNIVPMSPSDVLGAGIDRLPRQFAGLDASQRERFTQDMELEDDSLRPLIEKCRLDEWYKSALDQARRDFATQLKEEMDQGQHMIHASDALEAVEQRLRAEAKADSYSRLHERPKYQQKKKIMRGGVGKFRSSVKQY
jgi:nuclear pore complex protein Nup133